VIKKEAENIIKYTENNVKYKFLITGVLRRIFGPKREEVVGGCRRLHIE
jgi:hypothetical protein